MERRVYGCTFEKTTNSDNNQEGWVSTSGNRVILVRTSIQPPVWHIFIPHRDLAVSIEGNSVEPRALGIAAMLYVKDISELESNINL